VVHHEKIIRLRNADFGFFDLIFFDRIYRSFRIILFFITFQKKVMKPDPALRREKTNY
jgi:hypothetical protein